MTAVAIDTLKLARSLREQAKLPTDQAEGLANAIAIAEAAQGDLATKTDLREVELRLRADIEAMKFEILKWMIGVQTVLIIGAVVTPTRAVQR